MPYTLGLLAVQYALQAAAGSKSAQSKVTTACLKLGITMVTKLASTTHADAKRERPHVCRSTCMQQPPGGQQHCNNNPCHRARQLCSELLALTGPK